MSEQATAGPAGPTVPPLPVPERLLRVGDAERIEAVTALGEHFASGRLDQQEFDERVVTAYTARTRADLEPLFADLPYPAPFKQVRGRSTDPASEWPTEGWPADGWPGSGRPADAWPTGRWHQDGWPQGGWHSDRWQAEAWRAGRAARERVMAAGGRAHRARWRTSGGRWAAEARAGGYRRAPFRLVPLVLALLVVASAVAQFPFFLLFLIWLRFAGHRRAWR